MTLQRDELEALVAEIDGLLGEAAPRLPWVMASEATQQRQLLAKARAYLADLDTRISADAAVDDAASAATDALPVDPTMATASQILQALLQEMQYLRGQTMQILDPLRQEVATLNQQRELLLQEVQQLQRQRLQLEAGALPNGADRGWDETLQQLTRHLEAHLTNQVEQSVQRLEASVANTYLLGDLTQPPADLEQTNREPGDRLSPSQRLAYLNQIQAQTDHLVLNLDQSIRTVFEALEQNLYTYQDSLNQGLNKMHTLGQQGEMMFSALINHLARQMNQEARAYLDAGEPPRGQRPGLPTGDGAAGEVETGAAIAEAQTDTDLTFDDLDLDEGLDDLDLDFEDDELTLAQLDDDVLSAAVAPDAGPGDGADSLPTLEQLDVANPDPNPTVSLPQMLSADAEVIQLNADNDSALDDLYQSLFGTGTLAAPPEVDGGSSPDSAESRAVAGDEAWPEALAMDVGANESADDIGDNPELATTSPVVEADALAQLMEPSEEDQGDAAIAPEEAATLADVLGAETAAQLSAGPDAAAIATPDDDVITSLAELLPDQQGTALNPETRSSLASEDSFLDDARDSQFMAAPAEEDLLTQGSTTDASQYGLSVDEDIFAQLQADLDDLEAREVTAPPLEVETSTGQDPVPPPESVAAEASEPGNDHWVDDLEAAPAESGVPESGAADRTPWDVTAPEIRDISDQLGPDDLAPRDLEPGDLAGLGLEDQDNLSLSTDLFSDEFALADDGSDDDIFAADLDSSEGSVAEDSVANEASQTADWWVDQSDLESTPESLEQVGPEDAIATPAQDLWGQAPSATATDASAAVTEGQADIDQTGVEPQPPDLERALDDIRPEAETLEPETGVADWTAAAGTTDPADDLAATPGEFSAEGIDWFAEATSGESPSREQDDTTEGINLFTDAAYVEPQPTDLGDGPSGIDLFANQNFVEPQPPDLDTTQEGIDLFGEETQDTAVTPQPTDLDPAPEGIDLFPETSIPQESGPDQLSSRLEEFGSDSPAFDSPIADFPDPEESPELPPLEMAPEGIDLFPRESAQSPANQRPSPDSLANLLAELNLSLEDDTPAVGESGLTLSDLGDMGSDAQPEPQRPRPGPIPPWTPAGDIARPRPAAPPTEADTEADPGVELTVSDPSLTLENLLGDLALDPLPLEPDQPLVVTADNLFGSEAMPTDATEAADTSVTAENLFDPAVISADSEPETEPETELIQSAPPDSARQPDVPDSSDTLDDFISANWGVEDPPPAWPEPDLTLETVGLGESPESEPPIPAPGEALELSLTMDDLDLSLDGTTFPGVDEASGVDQPQSPVPETPDLDAQVPDAQVPDAQEWLREISLDNILDTAGENLTNQPEAEFPTAPATPEAFSLDQFDFSLGDEVESLEAAIAPADGLSDVPSDVPTDDISDAPSELDLDTLALADQAGPDRGWHQVEESAELEAVPEAAVPEIEAVPEIVEDVSEVELPPDIELPAGLELPAEIEVSDSAPPLGEFTARADGLPMPTLESDFLTSPMADLDLTAIGTEQVPAAGGLGTEPSATPEPPDALWFLGLDVGTSGLSAVLLDKCSSQAYPIYWIDNAISGATADKFFRLPTLVSVAPSAADGRYQVQSVGASTLTVDWDDATGSDDSEDNSVILKTLKPFLKFGIPVTEAETGDSQPQVQWSDQTQLPLQVFLEGLQALLATLSLPDSSPFTVGAVDLETDKLTQALQQLQGVVVSYPANWPDTYTFNLREVVIGAGLIENPEDIYFLEDAIATVLSGFPDPNEPMPEANSQPLQQQTVYACQWTGGTVVLSAGATMTEVGLVNLPGDRTQLSYDDFMLHSMAYAGDAIDLDMVCHLLHPTERRQRRTPNDYDRAQNGWGWQAAMPELDTARWDDLGLDQLDLPRPAEPDLARRQRLQQRLEASLLGQSTLEAVRHLKIILQHQPQFELELADQHWVVRSKELVDRIILPYIQRINGHFNQLLSKAGLSTHSIKQVICTGGSASLPKITHWLRQKFPEAIIIQDTYHSDRPPSCSRVAYGLANLVRYPQVLDLNRHQYSDMFLLLELLRTSPEQPMPLSGLLHLLNERGINTEACELHIAALLEGRLPPGLLSATTQPVLLPSAASDLSQSLAENPLFKRPNNQIYVPNLGQQQRLQAYMEQLLSDKQQDLVDPLLARLIAISIQA